MCVDFFFFFFQAEDGIRDLYVTGVQTCALPILLASGATESGATVHFADEAFDRGAIIAQEKVRVEPGDTPDTLAARVLEAEHRLLTRVVLDLARRIG